MSSLEAKREQFRKYLERCGVIDALSKALIKLYEETNKPDDAVRYVRKYMCEACPDDEQFDVLKSDLKMATTTIQNLEEELERFKGNLKRSASEIALLLEEGFTKLQEDADCKSLLKNYLAKDVYDELVLAKTENGATLLDIVQSGFECHAAKIGAFAADRESYETFSSLLDLMITSYHKLEDTDGAQLQNPLDWGDVGAIVDLDPDSKHIISIRIMLSRNMEGIPYFSKITEEQLKEVEEKAKNILEGLEGEHKGKYYTMRDIDPDTQAKMMARNILPKKGDPLLSAAGAYRFWPTGRGLFHNPAETFAVWVNHVDHVKILSMAKCGDLGDVYSRLVAGERRIVENIEFQRHARYGNLSPCLTNLGTGVSVSVHIKLPMLSKDMPGLEERCERLNLEIITNADDKAKEDGIMCICNTKRMGLSEYDIVRGVQEAIFELMKAEEELEP